MSKFSKITKNAPNLNLKTRAKFKCGHCDDTTNMFQIAIAFLIAAQNYFIATKKTVNTHTCTGLPLRTFFLV